MLDLIKDFVAMIRGYFDGAYNGADNNPYGDERRYYYRRGFDKGLYIYCGKARGYKSE